MEIASAEPAVVDSEVVVRPYSPSWVDRFTDWVRQLPMPIWVFYLGLALVSILLYTAVKWSDGSYPIGTFFPAHVLSALSPIYALALMHYLDNWAGAALVTFRPAMLADEGEYNKLHYQLTTLPMRQTIIASVVGALYGVSSLLYLPTQQIEEQRFFTSPLATGFDVVFLALGYAGAAVLIYHSIRQLRLISRIYTTRTRIDLFHLGPLYAFSKLSARTAIGFGLITYAWVTVNAEATGENAVYLIEPLVFTVIVILIFILPLLGIHRLLQEEKERLMNEAAQHLKGAIAELHRRREAGEFGEIGGINNAIDGILKERSVLDKIPTWPWQPGTVRGLGAALLLPMVIWGVQRLLERLGF